jgi:uncharacterized protein
MRFVCDVMLGKLARYLRLLGFDAAYVETGTALKDTLRSDPDRVVLTRRRKAEIPGPVIHLKSEIAREQLDEMRGVIKAAINRGAVLSRCIDCNVRLVEAEREEIEPFVPEFVYHHYRTFKQCPSCKKVYWEGSHAKGMEELIKEIVA